VSVDPQALVGRSVTVAVPATIANLGAGYDVLGLAIELHNELRVAIDGVAASGAGAIAYRCFGAGEGELPGDRRNLAVDAVYRGLTAAGVAGADRLSVTIEATNRIPLARGLGSSAAAIVAGLCAGAALAHGAAPGPAVDALSDELLDRLFAAADELEGHPDNVAAALFGGLVASGRHDGLLTARVVDVPDDAVPVVLVPDVRLDTAAMRAALPKGVSLDDAVHNASRLALGIAALHANDVRGFALLADDRLHQAARARRYPALPSLLDAATNAGATSACLAGSGSSVLAIVDDATGGDEAIEAVIVALNEAAERAKVGGGAEQYEIDHDGARVVAYSGA